MRDQDGDVVGPALRPADTLGDRRGQPGRPGGVERVRPRQHLAGGAGQPVEGGHRSGTAPGDGAVGVQHQGGALGEHRLGDRSLGAGHAAQRRARHDGQERRPAVGLHDERGGVPGGAVDEPTGTCVEHAVEDRGTFDVVHLPGEGVEGGEHHGRRGVAQRRGPHRAAQPAHRPRRGHAVPDGVTDDEGEAAVAERHRVVPVPTGGAGCGGPVVAARETQVGHERQGRREERELGLLDDVGAPRPGRRRARLRIGLQDEQGGRAAVDAQRPDDGGRRLSLVAHRPAEGLRAARAQHAFDDLGDGTAREGRQVVGAWSQRPGLRVGPDRLGVGGREAEDRRRRVLHGGEQGCGTRVLGILGTGWHTAGAGAHLRPANPRVGAPATAPRRRNNHRNCRFTRAPRGYAPPSGDLRGPWCAHHGAAPSAGGLHGPGGDDGTRRLDGERART